MFIKNNDNANWGCEFLDIPEYGDNKYYRIQKPWKSNGYALELPIHIMERIVDRDNLNLVIRRDVDRLNELRRDIYQNGLKVPGVVVINPTHIILKDGYHRFAICRELGYQRFPVTINHSEGNLRLKGWSHARLTPALFSFISNLLDERETSR